MNIDHLFSDTAFLEREIKFFLEKGHIKDIAPNENLIISHLEKAKHNIEFYRTIKNDEYRDWQIVVLYYALYHSCLALITKKNYSSKNHYATIILLIKEYSITKDEAELINDLSLSREEANLYTNLKKDRHDASYSTNTRFTKNLIENYEKEVIKFINKIQEIIS